MPEPLYIKRIIPEQFKVVRKEASGSSTPLKPVNFEFRQALLEQVNYVERDLQRAPERSPFVPMQVILERNAIAKSHWPYELFSEDEAPIIGAGKPGQLFIQLPKWGVSALKQRIANATTQSAVKALSAIQSLRPFGKADRLKEMSESNILEFAPRNPVTGKFQLHIELFKYFDSSDNAAKYEAFAQILKEKNIQVGRTNLNSAHDNVAVVECDSAGDVSFIADQVMVREVRYMPCYAPLEAQAFNVADVDLKLNEGLPAPAECPIVAVVDTGIDDSNPQIRPWIIGKEKTVADEYYYPDHGTFVAGLILWGDKLNSDARHLEALPCRLLDVAMLAGKTSPSGERMRFTEEEFLTDLEQAVKKYHKDVKVWNLSLSSNTRVDLNKFSYGATALDELQERYGISIVIAAGNYSNKPRLSYPRSDFDKDAGRITSPADTVFGITVGAISHCDLSDGASVGEPAPFSRNGPGPNYIIKPDMSHFGGNCQVSGKRCVGLTSTFLGNKQAEDIGTSFSTPLVSRQLAYIYHTITPSPSPTLARAILTHTARDMRTEAGDRRVPDEDDHYLGFGTPVKIRRAIECDPWQITMVFEETLIRGVKFVWDDFPYPDCLITPEGKFFGEINMTLAYPPKRGPEWGTEYCETHVEAHFGVVVDQNGVEHAKGQVPVEHRNTGQLYEHFQVQELRKWAPVRSYHRTIPEGISGKRWRLWVDMLTRHKQEVSQNFALILTISDPEKKRPVYNQMAVKLANRLKSENLALRPQVRNRLVS